jgi:hypothetical protein
MKAYLLSYDPNFANGQLVHNSIIQSSLITDWWHYLSGTYIVISNSSILALDNDIKTRWPDGWYILTEVKKPMVGYLTNEGWQWINAKLS